MIDLSYLKGLIELAKTQGLTHFKMQGLEFAIGQDPQELKKQIEEQESKLPPDLRADDLMNQDKLMFWSGSNDSQDKLPLTGE